MICYLCLNFNATSHALCVGCLQQMPWLMTACHQCARPIAVEEQTCQHCQRQPPYFDRTIAAFSYEAPLPYLITHLKFWQQLHWGRLLGRLLAAKVQQSYQQEAPPQCLLAVPLHTKRLQQRGYNQAAIIAKHCQKALQLPINLQAVTRQKATAPQTEVAWHKRAKNLHNAFALQRPLPYRHVAVIDDVLTTGNTLNSLAQTLKESGVERVDNWICARTVMS